MPSNIVECDACNGSRLITQQRQTIGVAGTACVVTAALCWGLAGGIGGVLINSGWDPVVVALYRGAIGLLFVGVWLALRPHDHGLKRWRLWFWSVLAGLGVAGNFAFYFISIAHGSVAVAATLMYCAPVFVFLVSFALGLESPSSHKWAAIVLVMLGITLLTRIYETDVQDITWIGVGAGLLAGISYALFIFCFKFASPHGSPQATLVIALMTLVLLLGLSADAVQSRAVPGSQSALLFAVLGVLGAGLSFILYVVGVRETTPAIASIVAMVEPVTAAIFGIVVLDERLLEPQLLGMVVILVTVTALSVSSGTRRSAPRNKHSWHRAGGFL